MGEKSYLCSVISLQVGGNLERDSVFHLLQGRRSLGAEVRATPLPTLALTLTESDHPSSLVSFRPCHLDVSVDKNALLKLICNRWALFCLCSGVVSALIAYNSRSFWHLSFLSWWIHVRKFLRAYCFCWLVNIYVTERIYEAPAFLAWKREAMRWAWLKLRKYW